MWLLYEGSLPYDIMWKQVIVCRLERLDCSCSLLVILDLVMYLGSSVHFTGYVLFQFAATKKDVDFYLFHTWDCCLRKRPLHALKGWCWGMLSSDTPRHALNSWVWGLLSSDMPRRAPKVCCDYCMLARPLHACFTKYMCKRTGINALYIHMYIYIYGFVQRAYKMSTWWLNSCFKVLNTGGNSPLSNMTCVICLSA